MAKHRVKEEKLKRIRLGSRYFGLNLRQFYWECLKLAAASEELSETDILRRVLRAWSETLPRSIRDKARAATAQVEAWKIQELRTPQDTKRLAKARLSLPGAARTSRRALEVLFPPSHSALFIFAGSFGRAH
jgi:hypothetical protein